MMLDFDRLECRSLFAAPGAATSFPARARSRAASGSIDIVEAKDVLYLPDVLEPAQSVAVMDEAFVPLESILDPWNLGFLKTTRRQNPELGAQYASSFEPDRFTRPACIVGNLFSRNFGHWTEELLKVAAFENLGVDCDYVMPALPPFASASLRFLGVEESRIVVLSRPTLFERAMFTTAASHENLMDHPAALYRLRELVAEQLGDRRDKYGRRLWLERSAGVKNGGMTTNRDEVYRCLEGYDFDVVDMATLSFRDQVDAVSGATIIAGPHGSQFVHAQFMPERSTVIECFSPMYVNPSVLQICRVLKHSYRQIVGRSNVVAPYAHGRDCEIDCAHLQLVLESLVS